MERFAHEIPELGAAGKLGGLALYVFDAAEREFKTFWAMSDGQFSHGEMEYDGKTQTWHLEGRGRDAMTGRATKYKETIRVVDGATMEWCHIEYDALGLTKTMEIRGTSKRKQLRPA